MRNVLEKLILNKILLTPQFFQKKNMLKTTGKPIKWIICFSPVLSKVFLQKSFTKNHEICRKLKKSVLGPAVYNPPRGITPKTKI